MGRCATVVARLGTLLRNITARNIYVFINIIKPLGIIIIITTTSVERKIFRLNCEFFLYSRVSFDLLPARYIYIRGRVIRESVSRGNWGT